MLKRFLSFLLVTVLTACHTITITSVPDNATVTLAPHDIRTTPCTVTTFPFMTKTVTVDSDTFDSAQIVLDFKTPAEKHIVLERTFTIDSQPQGASVKFDDSQTVIGQTPCTVSLPADAGTTAFTVTLATYLDSHFTLDPVQSPRETKLLMELNGPGRRYLELQNRRPFSFPVIVSSDIFSCPEDEDSTDSALSVLTFPPTTYPFSFKQTDVPGQLLFTLFKASQGRLNHRFRFLPTLSLLNLNEDNQTFKDITSPMDYAIGGSILPQTHELCYLSIRTGRLDIWKGALGQETKKDHKLFNTSVLVKTELDFSPSHKELLFCATKPEDMDKEHAIQSIWILNTSSSSNTARAVTRGHNAHWSPNGKQIVFQFMDNIWKIDSDGSQLTRLTKTKRPISNIDPSWSPDGKFIVYASNMDNSDATNFDIWMMDSNGANPRKLTHSRCRDDRPVFSYDGSEILFRSNRCLKWGLWKIEVK